MKKTLKKYFIPHPGNDHKPHFLREKSVVTTTMVAFILFLASIFGSHVVMTTPQLASIRSAFLVDLANRDREREGLPQLVINDKLVAAATMKASDMATKGYFAHQSPDGRQPWDFITAAGYTYVYAGENLAVNFYDSSEVERAWMDSPTHRKNIMNAKYTEIGIATAPGVYKGDDTTYVVQMFGRPRAATPQSAVRASVPAVTPVTEATTVAALASSDSEAVLGEETSVASSIPSGSSELSAAAPTVLAEPEEAFVEFQNPDVSAEEAIIPVASTETTPDVPEYTSWWERLIVSPSSVVQDLYMVLFAIVVFSLVLKIFIEIRLQHPRNIAYGLLLLVVIGFFMHMNGVLSSSPILAFI